MHDPRIDQLARQIVRYSTKVGKRDRVWIDCFDVPNSVAIAFIRAVNDVKGLPFVKPPRLRRFPGADVHGRR